MPYGDAIEFLWARENYGQICISKKIIFEPLWKMAFLSFIQKCVGPNKIN